MTDLSAAGETWLAGTNVWVRFRASDATLQTLLSGYEREPEAASGVSSFREGWGRSLKQYDPDGRTR